jgi:hypothetical protein
MTQDEFKAGFDKLVEAFNVMNADRKARIYFEELRSVPGPAFNEAVRRTIRSGERFPTIASLLSAVETIAPNKQGSTVAAECARCDGFGFVLFEKHAFRGRCEHGRKLSDRLAWAPETEIDRVNWRNTFKRQDREIYGERT